MREIFSLVFFLLCSAVMAQQVKIQVLEEKGGEAMAYRKVLFLPSNTFQVTDPDGYFSVPRDFFDTQESLVISGFGLADTLIKTDDLKKREKIFLKINTLELPEMVVSASKLKERRIGNQNIPVVNVNNPIRFFNNPKGSDYKYTVLAKLPNKRECHVQSIAYFISEVDNFRQELFSLRILGTFKHQNIKEGTIYKTGDFFDLLPNQIIEKPSSTGWNVIRLPETLSIPGQIRDIFIVFDLLKDSESFSLANQANKSEGIFHGFYHSSGIIGIFDKYRLNPAIVVNLLTN